MKAFTYRIPVFSTTRPGTQNKGAVVPPRAGNRFDGKPVTVIQVQASTAREAQDRLLEAFHPQDPRPIMGLAYVSSYREDKLGAPSPGSLPREGQAERLDPDSDPAWLLPEADRLEQLAWADFRHAMAQVDRMRVKARELTMAQESPSMTFDSLPSLGGPVEGQGTTTQPEAIPARGGQA
jgi:hypothetical protein